MNKSDNSNRKAMLKAIQIASFSVVETTLYLDTHPFDQEALSALIQYTAEKQAAVEAYEEAYGPITVCSFYSPLYNNIKNNASVCNCNKAFSWATEPWPWENDYC